MARRLRLRLAGMPLHIIQRGNNRAACFAADQDRLVYLALLSTSALRFSCAVHAYVLMTNHVHLLVTPRSEHASSLMMKRVGQSYVQYFNRTHERSGTLWEGRFKSCLIHDEAYLLACYRYIELNPVRAGLVAHPGEYPWSSYRANAGEQASPLIVPHPVLGNLGTTPAHRSTAYRALFEDQLDSAVLATIRSATDANLALVSPGAQADLEAQLGRRVRRRKAGRPPAAQAAAASFSLLGTGTAATDGPHCSTEPARKIGV